MSELSKIEEQILQMRADGATYKDISRNTGKTESAIKARIARLCDRFGCPHDVTNLVATAIRRSIID